MSYKTPYLRATSLADELIATATDPEMMQRKSQYARKTGIDTSLMPSTQRAFDRSKQSLVSSIRGSFDRDEYSPEDYQQEDPLDMTAKYIAGISDPDLKREMEGILEKARVEQEAKTRDVVPLVNFEDIRTGTTTFGFEMGPARPKVPEHMDTLMSIMDIAATATFGEGSRIVIKSGEGPHGSTRHRQGHAADIAVYRPDGSKVTAASKDARAFLTNAARAGILGIGAGEEYMGGSLFHLDIFPLERYAEEQGQRWNSLGSTIPTRFD